MNVKLHSISDFSFMRFAYNLHIKQFYFTVQQQKSVLPV